MKKKLTLLAVLCVAVSVLSCGCSRVLDRLTHGRESRNLTQVSSSPGKGTVRGRLILPSPSMSAPAIGTADVTVVLVDSSMKTIVSRDGSFVFTDVPAGTHTLLAEYSPLWKACAVATSLPDTTVDLGFIFVQKTGNITGKATRVRTMDHSGVLVRIGILDQKAYTDSNGVFALENVPPGTYELTASMAGYRSRSTTVSLGSGEHISLTFMELDPS